MNEKLMSFRTLFTTLHFGEKFCLYPKENAIRFETFHASVVFNFSRCDNGILENYIGSVEHTNNLTLNGTEFDLHQLLYTHTKYKNVKR